MAKFEFCDCLNNLAIADIEFCGRLNNLVMANINNFDSDAAS